MDQFPAFTPIGPQPEFEGLPSLDDTEPLFSEYFEAQAGNTLRDSPTSSAFRMSELAGANADTSGNFDEFGQFVPGTPRAQISAADASEMAKRAGVTVDFGTGQTTREAAEIMIDRARRRAVRDSVIAQYRPSIGTQLGVSVLASLADPLNIGAAFIPFAGQARYAAMLGQAASFGGRSTVRAGLGAVEGFGGSLLVEPLIAAAATHEGRDYTLADSLRNLMFGTALGGGLHVTGGTIAEKVFKRTYSNAPVQTPADIVDRLPHEMKEVGYRAATADIIEGRPVAAAEIVDAYARDNADATGRALTYVESLRRDGPSIDDTMERIDFWERRLAGAPGEKVGDFRQFLRDIGGIRDTGNTLRAELGDDIGNLSRGTLITEAGSKRTQRGIEAEAVIQQAVDQGFVADRAEFVEMLRTGGKGSLRKADVQTAEARAAEAKHTADMLREAGVNPNTRNALKARAIVGREQQIIATERARQTSSVQSFISRSLADDPVPIVEPLPPPGSSPLDDLKTRSPATSAKSTPEAGKSSSATDTLTAETDRRFAEIAKWLPPEKVAEVKAAMEASKVQLDDMNRVLESATACVMGI